MIVLLFDSTSDFVIGFTNTLIHSLWIGALLLLILKALLLLVRDNRSGIRYWISISGLLLFISAIVILFTQLYSPGSPTGIVSGDTGFRSLFQLAISNGTSLDEISSFEIYYPILLKIYLLGLTLFTIRWIVSAFQIHNIINKGSRLDSSAFMILEKLKLKLGIRKNINLLSSGKLTAPVLYGFFKPVIIVPTAMFFHLPQQQVESILMHELIHVKRMDFFVNLLQSFVELLFFFNPFVWMISRQIRTEREKFCDDMVVNSGSSPSVYAKALLNLSLLQSNKYNMAISATGNNRQVLLKRIQRLLNTNTMKTRNKQKTIFTYLLVVSFIVVFITSGFRSSFFTIDKGGQDIVPITEKVIVTEEFTQNEGTELQLPVTVVPIEIADTIVDKELDSMTEEEWEDYRQSLEDGLEELKNLDLDELKEEFEMHMQEIHADIEIDKEKLKVELEIAMEEMKNLQKEEIMLQLEETLQNVEEAMLDLDFDFDFDFDFDQEITINMDSIMKNAQIAIEEVNFEEIRQNIEEAMQKMEQEMQEMDERIKEKKEEK